MGWKETGTLHYLSLLCCEEVEDVVVAKVVVGEDVLLVLPRCVLFLREDLHGHRLILVRRGAGLPQLGLEHLSEAPLTHLMVI